MDFLHGTHQVAQKSITTTLPFKDCQVALMPAGAWSSFTLSRSGAGCPTGNPLPVAERAGKTMQMTSIQLRLLLLAATDLLSHDPDLAHFVRSGARLTIIEVPQLCHLIREHHAMCAPPAEGG